MVGLIIILNPAKMEIPNIISTIQYLATRTLNLFEGDSKIADQERSVGLTSHISKINLQLGAKEYTNFI